MNLLRLAYSEDDPPNRTGELDVEIRSGRYAAGAWAYVAADQLADFAASIGTYPMRAEGYMFEATPYVTLSIAPLDARGHLKVTALLASDDYRNGITVEQQAKLTFVADYGSVATFAQAVRAMLVGNVTEARLTDTN